MNLWRSKNPVLPSMAGGGYIGLELAENLNELGVDVTIIQRPKHLLNPFDPEMAANITRSFAARVYA